MGNFMYAVRKFDVSLEGLGNSTSLQDAVFKIASVTHTVCAEDFAVCADCQEKFVSLKKEGDNSPAS